MEIYDALRNDHEEIKQNLNELLALNEDDDYRFVLIEEINNALVPHARAEESVFYNTLRAVNADKSVVREAYKEHLEAEALLRILQIKEKTNFDWKATAQKLKNALEHHIEEEEGQVFAEARLAFSSEEAEMMAEAFETLKLKVAEQGTVKSTVDMVINMMPPRIADKLRNFGRGDRPNI